MLHLITAAKILDHEKVNSGVILRALGRKKSLPLASWPFGYAKLDEGDWKIEVRQGGRRIFYAKVPDLESDLARAIRHMPQSVILMSREAAERFLSILEKHRIAAEVHDVRVEL